MSTSDAIASASLVVASVALLIAWYAIKRANKTTSAATMVTLNEGFRSAWSRFFAATGTPQQENELAELVNLFEIACAIRLEGSLSGHSAELMSEYLENVLQLLVSNPYALANVPPLLQNAKTFKFIKTFLRMQRTTISVTIPTRWYES